MRSRKPVIFQFSWIKHFHFYCSRLSVLANFHHLEDLDLWGGAFYTGTYFKAK